ncbi:MAG TPA: hypothetical protein DCS83_01655 [Prevotella sp.]|nr:hypothetical protein [Prevotella sp.]
MTINLSSCADVLEDNGASGNAIVLKAMVKELSDDIVSGAKSTATSSQNLSPAVMRSKNGKSIYLYTTSVPSILPQGKYSISGTRGRSVTSDNFHDNYGLFIYNYPSTETWSSYDTLTHPAPSVSNEAVSVSKNWITNEYWEGSERNYSFFAYAPYNAPGVTDLPNDSSATAPGFHYRVPDNAVDESDLLVGQSTDIPGNYNNEMTMNFSHACTAIRIAIGKKMPPCTITKIRLTGAYKEADYDYKTDSWSNLKNAADGVELDQSFTITNEVSNKILTNEDNIFMMIPQTLPDYASIELTVNDGEEHTFSTRIGGTTWERGHMITYYLSTAKTNSSYVLFVSVTDAPVNGTGGTKNVSVFSYKQSFFGTNTPIPWKATYSMGDDTKEYSANTDSVRAFTYSGKGNPAGETFTTTLGPTQLVSDATVNSHTAILQSAADGSCNLAKGKETANCYVIHAPGTYTFPLVYGNSLNADSTANTAAYTSSGANVFVDHKGAQITSPYIYTKYTPADAVVVWQDAFNLITPSSVKLINNNHAIQFEVSKDYICQGNAIIAVRDADKNILWSWHIWVTDYDMNTIAMRSSGNINTFLTEPIGFCDAEQRPYASRKIYVHVTQTEGDGLEASDVINQGGDDYTVSYGNNAPFYQFGRKDPFPSSTGLANAVRPLYNCNYPTTGTISTTSIATTIAYPYQFNSSDGNTSLELWNAKNTLTSVNTNAVTKTIYDPSPSGFKLPGVSAFQGWSTSNSNYANSTGTQGRTFTNGGALFLPLLGDINYYRVYSEFGVDANYWTASPSGPNNGYDLDFTPTSVNTTETGDRYWGLSVIPTTE